MFFHLLCLPTTFGQQRTIHDEKSEILTEKQALTLHIRTFCLKIAVYGKSKDQLT